MPTLLTVQLILLGLWCWMVLSQGWLMMQPRNLVDGKLRRSRWPLLLVLLIDGVLLALAGWHSSPLGWVFLATFAAILLGMQVWCGAGPPVACAHYVLMLIIDGFVLPVAAAGVIH
jgi:hypothetical protein